MKIKIYLFRLAVALTAFIVGVSFLSAGQYLTSVFQTKKLETVALPPVAKQEAMIAPLVLEESINEPTDSASDANQTTDEEEFYADGDYYLIENLSKPGSLPKEFKDFEQISVSTVESAQASEENDYWGVPIPPKGSVFTNKEYKFVRVNIGNRQIAFQTETKKGISYKFVGKFIDYRKVSAGNDYADLVGHLIKMRDGKKIAEAEIRLEAGGC